MTGKLSKNFHGFGIGPLSNILAVKCNAQCLMWVRKFSLLIVLVTVVNSGLAPTLMRPIPKDPR